MKERLRQKGWTDDELDHLARNFIPQKESRLFIGLLLVFLAAAIVIVPYGYLYLITLGVFVQLLNVVLIVVALPLGWLFGVFLIDLDHLDHVHHVSLLILLPLLIIFTCLSLFSEISALSSHNALIGGILYAVAFIAPYAFLVGKEWNSKIGSSHL